MLSLTNHAMVSPIATWKWRQTGSMRGAEIGWIIMPLDLSMIDMLEQWVGGIICLTIEQESRSYLGWPFASLTKSIILYLVSQ